MKDKKVTSSFNKKVLQRKYKYLVFKNGQKCKLVKS